MVDAEPLAHGPSHGDTIDVGTGQTQMLQNRYGIQGKSRCGIWRSFRLVTLPGTALIKDDDLIVPGKVTTNKVPDMMIARLAGYH